MHISGSIQPIINYNHNNNNNDEDDDDDDVK